MRTEVKIAAVIVIVLIGVGTMWYMFWGRNVPQKGPEEIGQPAPEAPDDGDRGFLAEELPEETPSADAGSPAAGLAGSTPPSGDAGAPETAEVGMAGTGDSAGPDLASAAVGAGTPDADTTGTETPAGSERPWWELSSRYPARVTPPDEAASAATGTGTGVPAPGADSTETTPPDRYIVKDGDSYWSIAKKLYGDASLYKQLVEANPNIPPKSLRPGMTISAPLKPATPARTPAGAATTEPETKHGTTLVDAATGTRYYIVKQGDSGFWGISQAVFGTGNHMGAIQKLNPKLNPRALQPGQKVVVPTEAPALARRTAPTAPGAVATPPRRTTPRVTAGAVTGAPVRAVLPSGEVFD